MAKSKKKIIEDAVEELDWSVSFETQKNHATGKTDKYASFSGYSEAGEDLEFVEFYDSLDELPGKLFERYQDFDTEEHVKMWLEGKSNGVRGVPDVETLVKDANWIEDFLLELSEALRDALDGKEPKKKKSPEDKLRELTDRLDAEVASNTEARKAWEFADGLVKAVYGAGIEEVLIHYADQKGA